METIAGVEIYPILSLLIFFSSLWDWVLGMSYKKDKIDELSQMPLNDNYNFKIIKMKN
jgi:hypothetical protein